MAINFNVFGQNSPTVEPVRRMVGGRFGWAYHRFPIKGGITPRRAAQISWGEVLQEAASRPSFFARLLGKTQIKTHLHSGLIRNITTTKLRKKRP